MLSVTVLAQDCSQDEFASLPDVQGAVSRLLSFPGYTGWDDKILSRSGDLAAIAIIRSISLQEMNSPEKARQVLLILRMAFAAPQIIVGCKNRRPTATMLLLDELEHTKVGEQSPTEIDNTRLEIQHNTSTGRPQEIVSLEGSAVVDWGHTQWVDSVLLWTSEIKPGMTRKDLLRVFTTEGGISTRTQHTYVLKQCPYIKVDVEFLPAGNEQDHHAEMPEDKIVKISKPYLEYSITD